MKKKILNQEGEMVSFTKEGAAIAIEMYQMYKDGTSIEEIEEKFDLYYDPEDGSEHFEFRLIMIVANLSGIMDSYDSIEYIYETLHDIETTE